MSNPSLGLAQVPEVFPRSNPSLGKNLYDPLYNDPLYKCRGGQFTFIRVTLFPDNAPTLRPGRADKALAGLPRLTHILALN